MALASPGQSKPPRENSYSNVFLLFISCRLTFVVGGDILIDMKTKMELPKGSSRLDNYRQIRKQNAGTERVMRPKRGGSYRRPQGDWRKWMD